MKVLVIVELSEVECQVLDRDYYMRKNGLILELPQQNKKCFVEGCYGKVGASQLYCPEHARSRYWVKSCEETQ